MLQPKLLPAPTLQLLAVCVPPPRACLRVVKQNLASHVIGLGGKERHGPIRTYAEETAKQRPENFLDALSNSGPAVRLYSEGRAKRDKRPYGYYYAREHWSTGEGAQGRRRLSGAGRSTPAPAQPANGMAAVPCRPTLPSTSHTVRISFSAKLLGFEICAPGKG